MGISGDAWDVLREVTMWGPNFPCGHLEPVNESWAPVVTPVVEQLATPEDSVLAYSAHQARGASEVLETGYKSGTRAKKSGLPLSVAFTALHPPVSTL